MTRLVTYLLLRRVARVVIPEFGWWRLSILVTMTQLPLLGS
jgi:hypothetical protein